MYTNQPQLLTQLVEVAPQPQDQERQRRMRGVLTQMSLRDEKVLFAATRGGGPLGDDLGPALRPSDLPPEPPARIH